MARRKSRRTVVWALIAATATLVISTGGAVTAVSSGAATAPRLVPANPPLLEGTISGYAGMCLDNYRSGTANGNKIDLYRCNGTGAQNWLFNTYVAAGNGQYTGEIVNDSNGTYNGKCLNDANYGGVGSKVILWDCTKTSNEIWTYWTKWREYSVTIGGHTYCMNDPAYSTAQGTQQIMWTCPDTANEQYTLPPWQG